MAGLDLDPFLPITVSWHARSRAKLRVGEITDQAITDEVRLALLEGRVAKRRPRWSTHPSRPDSYARKREFFAWPDAMDRVYVITLNRGEKRSYVVKTTIVPDFEPVTRSGPPIREGYSAAA